MISKFTILGERCSGTNYLEQLILKKFNIDITWEFGWKHAFTHKDYPSNVKNNPHVLCLCIVRNPYDWIMSLWNQPHHIPYEYRNDFNRFLFDEMYSIHKCGTECTDYRNLEGTRIKHIFEMIRDILLFMIDVLPTLSHNYNIFTLEDLTHNTIDVLDMFYNSFDVEKKQDNYILIQDRVKIGHVATVNTHYEISDEIRHVLNSNVDWEVESRVGYHIIE
jgi:hypothetical protein